MIKSLKAREESYPTGHGGKPEVSPTDIHRLKCWPEFFEAIRLGAKRHDLRRADDRNFKVGDRLQLEEFDPKNERYTGRVLVVSITYITSAQLPCALSKDALNPNFCILSIAPVEG